MLWNSLPALLLAQAFGWVLMVLVPVLVVNGTVDERIRSEAFAIPAAAAPGQPWKRTVDEYAQRVSEAFGIRRSEASEFANWILEAAERQHIDPDLLASLVHTESTFRKYARSHRGAVGPAQVKPKVWSEFCGTSNLLDPAENIYCGAQVLSFLRDECGNERCALQAYNTGKPGALPNAARRYVAKIDRARSRLRSTTL